MEESATGQTRRVRLDWLDIAKGIAMLLVIAGHTVPYASTVRHLIFSFHMPLFFVLAGYTFRVKPFKTVLSASFQRLIIPTIAIFVIRKAAELATVRPSWSALLSFLIGAGKQLLFASGVDVGWAGAVGMGMMWFLVVLFFARLLLNFLLDPRRFKGMWVSAILLVGLVVIGDVIGAQKRLYLPCSLDLVPLASLFMLCGLLARQCDLASRLNGRKAVAIFIAAAVFWACTVRSSSMEMAARVNRPLLLSVACAIAGLYLACMLAMCADHFARTPIMSSIRTGLIFIGRNSMLLFTIHALDRAVPWDSFALLSSVSRGYLLVALLRCAYDVLLTWLVIFMGGYLQVRRASELPPRDASHR